MGKMTIKKQACTGFKRFRSVVDNVDKVDYFYEKNIRNRWLHKAFRGVASGKLST